MKFYLFVAFAWLGFLPVIAQTGIQPDLRWPKKIDSCLRAYKTAPTDTDKIYLLASLTDAYYRSENYSKALYYADFTRLMAVKLQRSSDKRMIMAGLTGEAEYCLTNGDVSNKRSNYKSALHYYFQALELYTKTGDRQNVGRIFSCIATVYANMGDLSESLNYSFKSLKIHEAMGNTSNIAIELNNIGAIYSDIKNERKAMEYFFKAKDLSLKIDDKKNAAIYIANIGSSYQKLCDSAFGAGNLKLSAEMREKAFKNYSEGLRMAEEVSDHDHAAGCLENIGILYANEDQYKEALPYFLKAFAMYKQLQVTSEIAFCAENIADAYYGLKQENIAESFLNQAVETAEQTKSFYSLMSATRAASKFYEKTNRPDKALSYYKRYIANRDSMFNQENISAIARAELNYEFEKKEAATKFENDKIIYKLEADNRLNRQLRLFLILVIVLAAILLFFASRAYKNKKRMAEFMSTENKRKEVLLQEVHHRINNNLQIISSLLSLQANSAKDEKLYEYLTQSQNRIQSLSVMHELLYQTDSPLQINMKNYLDKVMDYHRSILNNLPARVELRLDVADASFPTKTAVPIALILNELATNSTKYAFNDGPGGYMQVSLTQRENKWLLRVSDSGKGIPEDKPLRKDSLGLRLITIMAKQLNATLSKSNTPGATFELEFSIVVDK